MRLLYRLRVRGRLPRTARARSEGPAVLERIGGWFTMVPGATAVERGYASVCGVLGAVVLLSSAAGWRAAAGCVLGGTAGARVGLSLAGRAARAATARARDALPQVLDRLATCVLAGMSVERALRTVAPGTPGALGEALADGLRALDLGVPRAQVYARIADRSGLPELRAVLAALARAERFGTSAADALVAHADELRSRARAAAEAEARTAPVKLIFPLVLCFLPAFVLLTIAPIALSAMKTLSGL